MSAKANPHLSAEHPKVLESNWSVPVHCLPLVDPLMDPLWDSQPRVESTSCDGLFLVRRTEFTESSEFNESSFPFREHSTVLLHCTNFALPVFLRRQET